MNRRLLVISLATIVVAVPSAYLWYKYRLAQCATAFFERAKTLESEGTWDQAASYYQRYLMTEGQEDTKPEVQEKISNSLLSIAQAFSKGEPNRRRADRLNQFLYQAIGRAIEPQKSELRMMLSENLLRTHDFEEAERIATQLVETAPNYAKEGRKVIALSKRVQASDDDPVAIANATSALVAAAGELPGDVVLISTTALTLREHPQAWQRMEGDAATLADQLMNALVAQDPQNVEARLARYSYRSRFQLPDADGDLKAVLEIDPDNSYAMFLSATSVDSALPPEEQLDQAEPLLRRAIQQSPKDIAPYLMLAGYLSKAGKSADALKLLESAKGSVDNEFQLGLIIADLQIENDKLVDAERTIRELESQFADSTVNLDREERTNLDSQLQLLRARFDLAQGEDLAAIKKLQAVILATESGGGTRRTNEWRQASLLLARYYSNSGQWDRAGEYWSSLIEAFPDDPAIVTSGVKADLEAANPRFAVQKLDEFSRRSQLTDDLLVSRVQAHLLLQLGRVKNDRNWAEFERVLREAKEQVNDRSDLLFSEIRYLATREGEKEAALALLRKAEDDFGEDEGFWRNAALNYQQLGAKNDTDRAVSKYRELSKSPLKQATLDVAVLANEGKYDDALALLSSLDVPSDPEERRQMARLKLEALAAAKKPLEALQAIKPVIEKNPKQADLLRRGIEIAIRANDFKQAEAWEIALISFDGPRYENRFLQAQRQLLSYNRLSADERRLLERSIAELRSERPKWFEVIALAALQAQLQGDTRAAIADYELALNLGDRRPSTIQQLVTLLFERQQLQKAQDYLSLLVDDSLTNPLVDSMNIELAIRQDRQEAAIDLAREGVERFPDDVVRRLTLANVLLRFNERTEALQVLHEASRKFENDPGILLGLFNAFRQSGQLEEARQTLATLVADLGSPQERRGFMAAQGYELLGDDQAAKKYYEHAVAQEPSESAIRLKYAQFLGSRDPQVAREQYERVLQQEPTNSGAARGLAVLLATMGQEADWQRANELLNSIDDRSAESANTNDRLRAMLLSRKGRTRKERIANCQSAREILQHLIEAESKDSKDSNNRLLLVQVFVQEANLSEDYSLLQSARDQLREVVSRDPDNPNLLTLYLGFLLGQADLLTESAANSVSSSPDHFDAVVELKTEFLEDAEKRLHELEQLAASGDLASELQIIALKGRFLQVRGEQGAARKAIDDFVARQSAADQDAPTVVQEYLQFGQLYTSIGANEEAEQWYRKAFERAPSAYPFVVQSLLEQNKRNEATEFCLEIYAANPTPDVARVLAAIMTATDEPVASSPEADNVISTALKSHGDDLRLLQVEAVRLASLGENDEAISLFRKILQLDPKNLLALNNLATVLAEKPNLRAEALVQIEKAIAIAGRTPTLLDTQGTIYLKTGDAAQAIACLEEATAGEESDPRYYLHLAAAYQLAQRSDDAHSMLREARSFGIGKAVLTHDDRQLLNDLEEKFPTKTETASVPQ